MALAWLDPWRRVERKARPLEPWPHPARVALVEAEPLRQAAWQDALLGVAPLAELLAHEALDDLSGALVARGHDLAVVQVEEAEAFGLWLRRHAQRRPWVPIIALGQPNAELAAAWEQVPALRALVDPDAPEAPTRLAEAAVAALRWGGAQRQQAEALAAEGAQAAEQGQAIAAASGYLAAYDLGFLPEGPALDMEGWLEVALPQLAARPPLAAAAWRALCARAADRLDETALIRRARAYEKALPERASEAKAWLGKAPELEGWALAALDARLEAALTLRRLGRAEEALAEADGVLSVAGNVLPAHQLRAEALQRLGRPAQAAAAALALAGLTAKAGEVERARNALDWAKALGPEASVLARVEALDAELETWERALAEGQPGPKRPTLRACPRALCQEAAELSGLLLGPLATPGDPGCDVCGADLAPLPQLKGRCVLVVGDRLGLATVRTVEALGANRVILDDGFSEPAATAGRVAEADGVVLVGGALRDAGHVKAERALLRWPRPTVRVAFPGLRQIARALRLGLAPQLPAE